MRRNGFTAEPGGCVFSERQTGVPVADLCQSIASSIAYLLVEGQIWPSRTPATAIVFGRWKQERRFEKTMFVKEILKYFLGMGTLHISTIMLVYV
ncbi:hypothetical protein [Ensifer adhaerens]|uniref:hypothetical protein n=1 Tax=Ensifer adhaerens TaxID=106592 RepID=UPI00131A2230|nr:hypothetical protein [Ensifer adhaerens]